MTQDEILRRLQTFMQKGPVILAGTGLTIPPPFSIAGMTELTNELKKKLSTNSSLCTEWKTCEASIVAHGLEDGLLNHDISNELLAEIIEITANLISEGDERAATSLVTGTPSPLPAIARLLRYLTKSTSTGNPEVIVITPNYDRVIERACDMINVPCETGFNGSYLKTFDRNALDNLIFDRYREPVRRVKLFKPHGSLDWYEVDRRSIAFGSKPAGAKRIMITPGRGKYAASLTNEVMNFHRDRMNHHLSRTSALLVIGYGFNDKHLQTEINRRLVDGMECVIVTKGLKDHASKLPTQGEWMLVTENAAGGTDVTIPGQAPIVLGSQLWTMDGFVDNVVGRN